MEGIFLLGLGLGLIIGGVVVDMRKNKVIETIRQDHAAQLDERLTEERTGRILALFLGGVGTPMAPMDQAEAFQKSIRSILSVTDTQALNNGLLLAKLLDWEEIATEDGHRFVRAVIKDEDWRRLLHHREIKLRLPKNERTVTIPLEQRHQLLNLKPTLATG